MVWLGLGSAVLALVAACQGSGAAPTPSPQPAARLTGVPTLILGPTASAATVPSPTATAAAEAESAREYRALADRVINGIGRLTRIISGISIGLAGAPEDAPEAEGTVAAVKGSFELALEQLERTDPPPGYEGLHETLLDALSFYIGASSALLPDSVTGKADYNRFQDLMLQGGKNSHAAFATFDELRRKGREATR